MRGGEGEEEEEEEGEEEGEEEEFKDMSASNGQQN